MKRFLFYVAIMFGSLIAQAQPAVEFHDVTAAITDSVRIVPNFSLGDSRSYRATVKTVMARSDSSSVDYHMKVESVDSDHYGMFLILDNFVYDQSYYPDSEQLVEFFGNEGFHFYFNRHSLKVDSIDCSNLVKPLKQYLIKLSAELESHLDLPFEDTLSQIENDRNNGLYRMASDLLSAIIKTWADQYGRTYAMGCSRWIETDEDLEITEDEDIDTDIQVEETIIEEESEEMTDFSVQKVHQAFAHINEDGTFFYREKVSWESFLFDNWFEHQEASFDANGWPIEITSTITMGDTSISIHWQLIEEND